MLAQRRRHWPALNRHGVCLLCLRGHIQNSACLAGLGRLFLLTIHMQTTTCRRCYVQIQKTPAVTIL